MTDLKIKLDTIRKVFDVDSVVNIPISDSYIEKYYRINKIPYSIFHTKDFMYMGISRNGQYKFSDLQEAARFISKNIAEINGKKVLELATGRGANSFYLAKKFPSTEFYGIDLSPSQLEYAFKKARKTHNYFPLKGDYHDLKFFTDSRFDIIFEVEALCYSDKKETVLNEVFRVLKPGGLFILFDGYRNSNKEYTSEELLTVKLIERGMALIKFEPYTDFQAKAKKRGFILKSEENVSQYVIPTMQKFECLSKKFLSHHIIAKFIKKILPDEFLNNILPGYLMPYAMQEKLLVYMITVLKKPE